MRAAFILKLKPGALEEYKRLHDEIWPELVSELANQGIEQITLFIKDEETLVLYSEVKSQGAWDIMWNTDIHLRWGERLQSCLELTEQGTPASQELLEIWHLKP
jgi:L-rhamnose mutarotase